MGHGIGSGGEEHLLPAVLCITGHHSPMCGNCYRGTSESCPPWYSVHISAASVTDCHLHTVRLFPLIVHCSHG